MGNIQGKGLNNKGNMRKRMPKLGETYRELSLGGFLSHIVTGFKAAS